MVCHVLSSLDVKKAVGPDGVSPYILKGCCNELCLPVHILFSHVCRSGEFPLSWKLSRIVPGYKQKGTVTDPCFYHPNTVLPTLAMVFEWVAYCRYIYLFICNVQTQ